MLGWRNEEDVVEQQRNGKEERMVDSGRRFFFFHTIQRKTKSVFPYGKSPKRMGAGKKTDPCWPNLRRCTMERGCSNLAFFDSDPFNLNVGSSIFRSPKEQLPYKNWYP